MTAWFGAAILLSAAAPAGAVSVTGADWIVHYNLPDQNAFAVSAGEYEIRDALLRRIDALQAGDDATLATYSFSGNTAGSGAAGPILQAMSNALARGAVLRFAADKQVDVTSNFWPGVSLTGLAGRASNPLVLSRDDSPAGTILHDKLGVFRYGTTSRWVFVTSWNFTGGASIYQWNIALEIRNDVLHAAYSNELRELLEGRFHDHADKSHAHDGTRFRLAGSWGDGWVRFAPYPDGTTGGTNAQTDILLAISNAQEEIVFGLNKLTRPLIAQALVKAADRGVRIHGSIPKSDWAATNDDSYWVYSYLTNLTNYASANVVNLVTPYSKADGSALDSGETDLVHEKYMVIDPWGAEPVTIHGSANWTDSALVSTSANDENVVFVKHAAIARLFYSQYKRMTGLWQDRDDWWCEIARDADGLRVSSWITDTNAYVLEEGTAVGEWTSIVAGSTGRVTVISAPAGSAGPRAFYRAVRQP